MEAIQRNGIAYVRITPKDIFHKKFHCKSEVFIDHSSAPPTPYVLYFKDTFNYHEYISQEFDISVFGDNLICYYKLDNKNQTVIDDEIYIQAQYFDMIERESRHEN